MYNKEYYENNKEKVIGRVIEWQKQELVNNPKYKTTQRIRSVVRNILVGETKRSFTLERYLGYDVDALIKHIQTTIPIGYTWQDVEDGVLVLDHIIPVKHFTYTSYFDEDFRKCWNYRNLRLVLKEENDNKNDKFDMDLIQEYGIEDLIS